jgi:hypothetical protein
VIADGQQEPSVGVLLGTLARDTGVLVRQEMQLASTEMTLKARRVARNMALIAMGGGVSLVGFAALMIAAIAALHFVLPLWLSALIVGIPVMGLGYALISKPLEMLKQMDPVPERTKNTLAEDVEWAKEQVR